MLPQIDKAFCSRKRAAEEASPSQVTPVWHLPQGQGAYLMFSTPHSSKHCLLVGASFPILSEVWVGEYLPSYCTRDSLTPQRPLQLP